MTQGVQAPGPQNDGTFEGPMISNDPEGISLYCVKTCAHHLSPAAAGACQVGILFAKLRGQQGGYIYKSILLSDVCLLGKTKRLLSWGHIFFSVNSHLQTCLLFGCLGQLVVF